MSKANDACNRCLKTERRIAAMIAEHKNFEFCFHCKWGGEQSPVEDNEGK